MKRRDRVVLAAVVVAASLACARQAGASPEFPGVIQSYLQLPSRRPCTLCHSAAGDAGPADTPFADSALARGMVQADDGSLQSALDRMRSDRVDSDGDTMADVDELAWGTDPNVPDRPQGDVPPALGYGCSAASQPSPTTPAWLIGAVGACCCIARRRRP